MKRIFSAYAYGPAPRAGCWWDQTVTPQTWPTLQGDIEVDVAIVGGGFTGLSAALHLAQAGAQVALLDSEHIAWGASGRNGGFCCLGGTMLDDATLDRQFGEQERLLLRQTEKTAVQLVDQLLRDHKIDVDRHSAGETELAHRRKDMIALRAKLPAIARNYGVSGRIHDQQDLAEIGMNGPFFGALTVPIGFALNPAKYAQGLAAAAHGAQARIFERSAALSILPDGRRHRIACAHGSVRATDVIIATNGYSSEDLPPALAGRYLSTQSSVLVTRPLSQEELSAQGWHSDQMGFDSRSLLHYFRLMPDRRFLFGMRGGLLSSPASDTRAHAALRRDFRAMFPAWSKVETPHYWSGMVCLARRRLPFVGALPGAKGLWAGLCYHGNGVAMGSFAGQTLAQLVQGQTPAIYPRALRGPLAAFPLGRARRALLPAVYAGLILRDF